MRPEALPPATAKIAATTQASWPPTCHQGKARPASGWPSSPASTTPPCARTPSARAAGAPEPVLRFGLVVAPGLKPQPQSGLSFGQSSARPTLPGDQCGGAQQTAATRRFCAP
jgi:hypothetical protein